MLEEFEFAINWGEHFYRSGLGCDIVLTHRMCNSCTQFGCKSKGRNSTLVSHLLHLHRLIFVCVCVWERHGNLRLPTI